VALGGAVGVDCGTGRWGRERSTGASDESRAAGPAPTETSGVP
jgi:hypothetical protein